MVYWWNICGSLHESCGVCVCVCVSVCVRERTFINTFKILECRYGTQLYKIHPSNHSSFIWSHICASVCIFLILLWQQQFEAGVSCRCLQLAALHLTPRSDYRRSESSDVHPPRTARLSASSSGVLRPWLYFFFFAHYVTDGWRGRTLPDLTETRRESDTVPSCCWLIYSEQRGSERMDQDAARIISALKTWNCLLVLSVTWYSMCYYHKLQHLKLFFLPSLWTAWRLWLYSLVSFKASLF